METLKIEKQDVKMIAHRGLSGLEAENTIEAFVAAANRTYFGIECDIHLTKDERFVVINDSDTKRVSPISMIVGQSTYDELLAVDLFDYLYKDAKRYRKIPQLEEYLEICKKYEKKAIIEIKPILNEEQIYNLRKVIDGFNYLEQTTFISSHLDNLKLLRKIDNEIMLQYLVTDYDIDVVNTCRKHKLDVNICYKNLSLDIVNTFKKYGIKVSVYTVNNPIVALMLVTWQVDFITTNILE